MLVLQRRVSDRPRNATSTSEHSIVARIDDGVSWHREAVRDRAFAIRVAGRK
jgi:hypothetical protein